MSELFGGAGTGGGTAASFSAGISTLGNTAGTTGFATDQIVFVGSNNITLSQSLNLGSATLSIIGGAGGGAFSGGVSTGGNTAGSTGAVSASILFVGGNGITLSQSTGGNSSATITISGVTQSLQTQVLSAGLSTGGNTSGDTGLVSRQLVLAGGNNITLSGSTNGSSMTITISGPNAGGAQTGISGIVASDATYTSGTVTFTGVGGGVTVASNTGQRVDISVATPVPIATAVKNVGSADSVGTITRYAPEDHAHRGLNQFQITGNTSNTSNLVYGSLWLAGGNNITLSQVSGAGAATVTISAANETQTVPPIATAVKVVQSSGSTGTITRFAPEDHAHQGVAGIDVNGVASTFFGTYQLSAGAGVSIATGGNTSRGSAQIINIYSTATSVSSVGTANAVGANNSRFALEAHIHGGVPTVSLVGNTSGDTTQGNLSLVLAGGPNVTLSGATAAGVMTVSISAPAAGAGTYTFSGGMSTMGNTSGDTGYATQRLNLAGGNNITLSGSTNGGSMTITISAGAGGGGFQSAGISTQGNTAGTTGFASARLHLVGTNLITLSQSVDAGNSTATLTIVGPTVPTVSHYAPLMAGIGGTAIAANVTHASMSTATLWIFPLHDQVDIFPGNMTFGTALLNMSCVTTNSTQSTQAHTSTVRFGIYRLNNATQLTRVLSGSRTWGTGAANASISSLYTGVRWLTFHSSDFDANTLSNTSYWGALVFNTAGTLYATGSMGPVAARAQAHSGARSGFFFAASSSNVSYANYAPFQGYLSATTNAMPATVAMSDLVMTGSGWAQLFPDVRLLASNAASLYGII